MVVTRIFDDGKITYLSFPRYIFRYYRINENFIETLSGPYLWFSKPDQLNDPFDCMDVIEGNASIEEIRWYVGRYLDDPIAQGKYGDAAADGYKPLSKDDAALEKFRTGFQKSVSFFHWAKMKQISVCCFSDQADVPLMWSHYADGHRGVCVAYDTEKLIENAKFSLYEVEYTPEFPTWNPVKERMIHGETDLFNVRFDQSVLCTKTMDWTYEQEHRLLSHSEGRNEISKNAIFAVLLGYKMTKEDKSKIVNELGDVLPEVGFFDTKLDFQSGKIDTFPFKNTLVKRKVASSKHLRGSEDVFG